MTPSSISHPEPLNFTTIQSSAFQGKLSGCSRRCRARQRIDVYISFFLFEAAYKGSPYVYHHYGDDAPASSTIKLIGFIGNTSELLQFTTTSFLNSFSLNWQSGGVNSHSVHANRIPVSSWSLSVIHYSESW